MVRPMATATRRLPTPSATNSSRRGHPGHLQQRDDRACCRHEGGIEHVDGGDHARAAVGAGPGLHRREQRHDEQAARDRKPGEIDREANAAQRAENAAEAGKAAIGAAP